MKLTPKQEAFCIYYLELANAAAAARKAGYSPKTADAIGRENLQKPTIRLYIDEQLKLRNNKRIDTAEEVMEFLSAMRRGEIQEETVSVYKDRSEIVKKQASPRDRIKAAELMGKRYAMFTDRIEATQNVTVEWVEYDDSDD